MQGHPAVSSVRNIIEDLCTEEGTGAGKAIFDIAIKFSASEARKKFDSTYSAVQREEDWYASPSTKEH